MRLFFFILLASQPVRLVARWGSGVHLAISFQAMQYELAAKGFLGGGLDHTSCHVLVVCGIRNSALPVEASQNISKFVFKPNTSPN